MKLDRRTVLGLSGYALAASLMPVRGLQAATMNSLRLFEPVGKPSLFWAIFDLLRPGLQQLLNCPVVLQAVRGQGGFDAIHAVLQTNDQDVGLVGVDVMASQYGAKTDIRVENMTPIAKLMNGYSVTLFTTRGNNLRTWAQIRAAKQLKVSSPAPASAAFLAALMLQRKGHISAKITPRGSIGEVIDDVNSGRAAVGILPTVMVATNQDQFQAILSFGAERSAMLTNIPTFAEAMGDPKLAFTDSIGVFGSPQLDSGLAARLTNAFILAGGDQDVQDQAEAENIPLVLNRAPVLVATMQRNQRVLQRILG
ncbi:MAG TPA: tripartite tricarboxylate transporter substrate-binding protein [Verrucomicrobiae bacterium]|jgi:tripartite-type tricarboxylate transporter receptor subunit TctC|nr:tripartite tricarboxylate transporter substrate-binding protein [Verrucomicrobiae bacterium]